MASLKASCANFTIHLTSQVSHLRCVAWILEHHHVLRVKTDGTTLLVFREQVLYEIQHGRVPVVTFLVNKVVIRSSVSAMGSTMTMSFLVDSNMAAVGNPSPNRTSIKSIVA